VAIWIGVVVVGLIAAGIALKRRFLPSSRASGIDLGEVSQSWLTEQKAEKRHDRF
jgi:hypothetical protein